MKIVLCDDQKIVSEELSVLLKKFEDQKHMQNEYCYFAKPSESSTFALKSSSTVKSSPSGSIQVRQVR